MNNNLNFWKYFKKYLLVILLFAGIPFFVVTHVWNSLLWVGTLLSIFLILSFLGTWILNNRSSWRNIFSFIVAGCASFALGFVIDIIIQVVLKDILFINALLPLISWSDIFIICFVIAYRTVISEKYLCIPFIINAGLAAISSLVHVYNLIIVFVFMMLITFIRYQKNKSPFFAIGQYKLNMEITKYDNLTELTSDEYKLFTKHFKDEVLYHARPIDFLGYPWEIMLGIVNCKLYKIGIYYKTRERIIANKVAEDTLNYCLKNLEKPLEQEDGFSLWKDENGNVILQTALTQEFYSINLYMTSSISKNFSRI